MKNDITPKDIILLILLAAFLCLIFHFNFIEKPDKKEKTKKEIEKRFIIIKKESFLNKYLEENKPMDYNKCLIILDKNTNIKYLCVWVKHGHNTGLAITRLWDKNN